MATKAAPLARGHGDNGPYAPGRFFGGAADFGIILILIFTPFAFGGVQPWATAVLHSLAFTVLGLFLVKESLEGGIKRLTLTPLFIPFAVFYAVVLIQALPLPPGALAYLSARAASVYAVFTDASAQGHVTLSLARGETAEGLFTLLSYSAVFFVVVNGCRTKARAARLFGAIIAIGIALTVFGVTQKAAWNGKLYWFYPISPALEARASGIFGPYVNKNHFAGYMELAIPLALGFVLYKFSGHGGGRGGVVRMLAGLASRAELMPTVLYLLAAAALSAALLMTLSRGGILGFVSSAVFFATLAASRRSLKKSVSPLLLAAAFVLLLLLAFGWTRIEGKFLEIKDIESFQRPVVWADSLKMWSDFPVFGIGLGAFNPAYKMYQSRFPAATFEHAENDYVELLSETGVLGAGAFAVMVAVFFYVTLKKWRSRNSAFVKCMALGGLGSCVAIIVHSMTDFNMRIPANAVTLTVIAAATYATLFSVPGRADGGAAPRMDIGARPNYPAAAAVAVLTAVLLYFPVKGLVSEYYHYTAYLAVDDPATGHRDSKPISQETVDDYMQAIGRLETASRLSPWRADYHKDAADIYAALARWAEAMRLAGETSGLDPGALYERSISNLKKAVELEPANPRYHLAMAGVIEDARPGAGLAEKSLGRAVSAYPVNAEVRFSAARAHLLNGRTGPAASEAAVVAKTDDSYMVRDEAVRQMLVEERGAAYYKKYGGSYLFGALEIIWMATKDADAVRRAAPDNPDAAEVLRIFLEQKGFSDDEG